MTVQTKTLWSVTYISFITERLSFFIPSIHSNKHFNAAFTSPIHAVKQVPSYTPAANVEILYISPSPQLPYILLHSISSTQERICIQPLIKPLQPRSTSRIWRWVQCPEQLHLPILPHGTVLLDAVMPLDMVLPLHREHQKKRAKLMKTRACWEWARARKDLWKLIPIAVVCLGVLVGLWIWITRRRH